MGAAFLFPQPKSGGSLSRATPVEEAPATNVRAQ